MENTAPIVKSVIHTGQKYIPIADGSKVISLNCDSIQQVPKILLFSMIVISNFQAHFHFQTWKLGKERVLIDDSKKIGKKEPMVLVIGHKFKLEVWETIVKMMAVGEVASFQVKKEVNILDFVVISY